MTVLVWAPVAETQLAVIQAVDALADRHAAAVPAPSSASSCPATKTEGREMRMPELLLRLPYSVRCQTMLTPLLCQDCLFDLS